MSGRLALSIVVLTGYIQYNEASALPVREIPEIRKGYAMYAKVPDGDIEIVANLTEAHEAYLII